MINEPSKDIVRQRAYVDTIIENITQQHYETNVHTIHGATSDKNINKMLRHWEAATYIKVWWQPQDNC